MNKSVKIVLGRTGIGLLAMNYIAVGVMKLAGGQEVVGMFADYGLPAWLVYAVGAAETACGAGLLRAKWRRGAAAGLAVVMAGAAATMLLNREPLGALVPLGYLTVLVGVAVRSRGGTVDAALADSAVKASETAGSPSK